MLEPLTELSFAEAHVDSVHSLSVAGQVGVVGASRVGRRLLAILNEGAYRVVLDLSRAEPIADCALLGTLLRLDRYATRRGARLVVVSGAAMEQTLQLGNTRGLLTIAATHEQAEALLARGSAISAPIGQRRAPGPSPRAGG
jgi:anti-anti-sigma regulatory factor